MEPRFFKTEEQLHRWFSKHAQSDTELWIGFFRAGMKQTAVTYAQALDEALCWGWIDGIRKKIDDERYTSRFTPRKSTSIWSLINVGHVNRLIASGRMQPSGLTAFEKRTPAKTGIYSFESPVASLSAAELKLFASDRVAYAFWKKQPPSYQRVMTHWISSAKRPETRQRRLAKLIENAALEKRIYL